MYFHKKLICGMEKKKCNSQYRSRDAVQFDFFVCLEFIHAQNNFAYFGKVLFKYIVNGRQNPAAAVLDLSLCHSIISGCVLDKCVSESGANEQV
jgi:hypothetical protein